MIFLWDEKKFFSLIDGLRSSGDTELFEKISGMCLHRAQGNKKSFGYFRVAKAFGHQLQHFQLPFADVKAI